MVVMVVVEEQHQSSNFVLGFQSHLINEISLFKKAKTKHNISREEK